MVKTYEKLVAGRKKKWKKKNKSADLHQNAAHASKTIRFIGKSSRKNDFAAECGHTQWQESGLVGEHRHRWEGGSG